MVINISKTDYLLYRLCKKNTWLKFHEPDLYYTFELSAFEEMIVQSGNEVELAARKLFPTGILIEGRDKIAQDLTFEYIHKKEPILFQAVFAKDDFLAAVDILKFDPEINSYSLYEVKANNDIDDKVHYHDLAFQVNLLRRCGLPVEKMYLIHLNKEYVRKGDLDPIGLFQVDDVTQEIESLCEEVSLEMDSALVYLSQEVQPVGYCECVYKGRSAHCTSFSILNPDIPEYSVHDIARIGSSKKKLMELIDSKSFELHQIPPHVKLSDIQQNQVDAYVLSKIILNKEALKSELKSLVFPLYFIDYETLPSALPRFDGYSPYQHIPFQYSLYVLEKPEVEPKLLEFLHADPNDPSLHFVDSLRQHIGDKGSIIVWNKTFECGRNEEIAARIPEMEAYLTLLNERVYDLMDIFKKQYYVHKDFKGSTSIKKVLPVLVPTLTYKELEIRDGGSAAEIWNRLSVGGVTGAEKEKIVQNLKKYCGLDAFAMYAIWKELTHLII